MTFSWLLIDAVGRRYLMCWNSVGLVLGFSLLTLIGGLAQESGNLHIPTLPVGIFGCVVLYVTTGCFGIGWLAPGMFIFYFHLTAYHIKFHHTNHSTTQTLTAAHLLTTHTHQSSSSQPKSTQPPPAPSAPPSPSSSGASPTSP